MAQATYELIPNFVRFVADDSAGTLTFQTYDSGSSSYVARWTMDSSSGNITVAQAQTITGSQTVDGAADLNGGATAKNLTVDNTSTFNTPIKNNSASKSVTGTTAGSFTWVMPQQGSGYKEVLVYFNGYENDSTTAQTVSYPVAFAETPAIENPASVGGLSTDTTHLTINPDSTSKYTGWVKVWGF